MQRADHGVQLCPPGNSDLNPGRAERRARESLFELTQMNRMATAGELSAAIAHEIKQPLTGIVTMANAALRWLYWQGTRRNGQSCGGRPSRK